MVLMVKLKLKNVLLSSSLKKTQLLWKPIIECILSCTFRNVIRDVSFKLVAIQIAPDLSVALELFA